MENRKKLDFIGEVLCPMKASFNDGYQAIASEHRERTGESWFSYVPTICGGDTVLKEAKEIADELSTLELATFPDVVASFGIDDYFHSAFCEHMLGKGYFEKIETAGINKSFANTGILEADGEVNIYAAYPVVFLVDKRKLGNLPVPRTWGDLLDPIYKGNITMSGSHGRPSTTVLLNIYKEFGEDGIRGFESNVKQAIHPAQMAKMAGTLRSEGTGIYTIMNFFGRARGDSEYTELVWPDDGAVFDPAFIIIKKGMKEKYMKLINYITGAGLGQLFADNGFPSVHPEVDNKLADRQELKWIGWDFLRENKPEEIMDELTARFQRFMVE